MLRSHIVSKRGAECTRDTFRDLPSMRLQASCNASNPWNVEISTSKQLEVLFSCAVGSVEGGLFDRDRRAPTDGTVRTEGIGSVSFDEMARHKWCCQRKCFEAGVREQNLLMKLASSSHDGATGQIPRFFSCWRVLRTSCALAYCTAKEAVWHGEDAPQRARRSSIRKSPARARRSGVRHPLLFAPHRGGSYIPDPWCVAP